MFKSQKLNSLFLCFFLFAIVSVCSTMECSAKNYSLLKADSLFKQKKYTEAFTLYQALEVEGTSTSSMYLKMAYIKEALNDIPGTLYFLNKYYLLSQNKIALKKMESLAEKNGIQGYEYSDKEFLENLLVKHGAAISFAVVVVLMALFVLTIYQNFYQRLNKKTLSVFLASVTMLIIINSNIRLDKKYGIVNANNAFVMSNPSSGSNIIENTKLGNRFIVLDDNDIWLKLSFSKDDAYIRKTDMLLINEKQSLVLWIIDQLKNIKS